MRRLLVVDGPATRAAAVRSAPPERSEDLTRCADDILLAREAHFSEDHRRTLRRRGEPADLRAAHERNDEVPERIYIGRRFRNDTERLEKLFDLYTKMTAARPDLKKSKAAARA